MADIGAEVLLILIPNRVCLEEPSGLGVVVRRNENGWEPFLRRTGFIVSDWCGAQIDEPVDCVAIYQRRAFGR